MSDLMYRVRALRKSYGPKAVLDGIDFDLARGECLVVLGRSGCGKSVTLRQLNGLEKPDSGTIEFDGVDIVPLAEKALYPLRRRVSMLFQGGALFDSMNVFDNVAFPLREHADLEEDGIAETVRQKLAMVRLEPGVESKMPSALSGGMRKRVAFARSLALDPEVVLYDEPTTGLDPVTSSAIAQLMATTQAGLKVSSVVVTHDLPLARTVGDRIGFLENGRFRFLGTWDEADRSGDTVLSDFLAGRAESEHAA